jgi:hypothetical protein
MGAMPNRRTALPRRNLPRTHFPGGGARSQYLLLPGNHEEFAAMNRFVRHAILGVAMFAGSTAMAGVTFYESENFGGRRIGGNESMPNFRDLDFNDDARSAIVEGGAWEVCVGTDFDNKCTVLAPGRYPDLGEWSHRISSARPVGPPQANLQSPAYLSPAPGAATPGREPPRERVRGGDGAGATLYSGRNRSGRALALGSRGSGNLAGPFNDRGSSLRIDRGYWIFCSDANFGGECRTFGPGEYRSLPPELDNRISSGRRISNNYPYTDQPNWR